MGVEKKERGGRRRRSTQEMQRAGIQGYPSTPEFFKKMLISKIEHLAIKWEGEGKMIDLVDTGLKSDFFECNAKMNCAGLKHALSRG